MSSNNLISILSNKCLIFVIAFIIITDILYTIINFYMITPIHPNIKKRLEDGYVIDTHRVMENCDMRFRSVESCLEFLDQQEDDYMIPSENPSKCNENEPPMLFHVFWRGMITDKLALQMKSFLYTQPLACS